jgi:hypothetical protein
MTGPFLSVTPISKPVSSHIFNVIRDAVDRIMSTLDLSKNEALTRLVPAIEITSIIMLQSQLPLASLEALLGEVESYLHTLLSSQDSQKLHPENVDVLFIALSSNSDTLRRPSASASTPSFVWETSQMSLISQGAVSKAPTGFSSCFAPVRGLPKQVSSLPAYVFSTLPLDSYTRASDSCFEINVLDGIECIGLSTLSRSELQLRPYLLEDSTRSYVLQVSSDKNCSTLSHDGKLISVLPLNTSDSAKAVNVLYCPSQKTATFSMPQSPSKWSHTFEGLPSSDVFLFAKLRGTEESRTLTWNVVSGVPEAEPTSK